MYLFFEVKNILQFFFTIIIHEVKIIRANLGRNDKLNQTFENCSKVNDHHLQKFPFYLHRMRKIVFTSDELNYDFCKIYFQIQNELFNYIFLKFDLYYI